MSLNFARLVLFIATVLAGWWLYEALKWDALVAFFGTLGTLCVTVVKPQSPAASASQPVRTSQHQKVSGNSMGFQIGGNFQGDIVQQARPAPDEQKSATPR